MDDTNRGYIGYGNGPKVHNILSFKVGGKGKREPLGRSACGKEGELTPCSMPVTCKTCLRLLAAWERFVAQMKEA